MTEYMLEDGSTMYISILSKSDSKQYLISIDDGEVEGIITGPKDSEVEDMEEFLDNYACNTDHGGITARIETNIQSSNRKRLSYRKHNRP